MILIRECYGHDELQACVDLQEETWGYDPTDVIPRKAFLVMQKVGGQVLGAFDTDLPGASAEGRCQSRWWALPCLCPGSRRREKIPRPPLPYLHSHMLAVKEALPQSRAWRATQAGATT